MYICYLLRERDQRKNCTVFSILEQVYCMEIQWLANTAQWAVQRYQESD